MIYTQKVDMTDWDRKINKAHEKKPVIIENRCSSIQKI